MKFLSICSAITLTLVVFGSVDTAALPADFMVETSWADDQLAKNSVSMPTTSPITSEFVLDLDKPTRYHIADLEEGQGFQVYDNDALVGQTPDTLQAPASKFHHGFFDLNEGHHAVQVKAKGNVDTGEVIMVPVFDTKQSEESNAMDILEEQKDDTLVNVDSIIQGDDTITAENSAEVDFLSGMVDHNNQDRIEDILTGTPGDNITEVIEDDDEGDDDDDGDDDNDDDNGEDNEGEDDDDDDDDDDDNGDSDEEDDDNDEDDNGDDGEEEEDDKDNGGDDDDEENDSNTVSATSTSSEDLSTMNHIEYITVGKAEGFEPMAPVLDLSHTITLTQTVWVTEYKTTEEISATPTIVESATETTPSLPTITSFEMSATE